MSSKSSDTPDVHTLVSRTHTRSHNQRRSCASNSVTPLMRYEPSGWADGRSRPGRDSESFARRPWFKSDKSSWSCANGTSRSSCAMRLWIAWKRRGYLRSLGNEKKIVSPSDTKHIHVLWVASQYMHVLWVATQHMPAWRRDAINHNSKALHVLVAVHVRHCHFEVSESSPMLENTNLVPTVQDIFLHLWKYVFSWN